MASDLRRARLVAQHRNARRTARATFRHPRRVPRLGFVLLVVTASVLVLLPAWLGALLGFPLD